MHSRQDNRPIEPPDDELVLAAVKDRKAFAQLYRRYVISVYRYILAKVGNADEAEDITSAVFLDALSGLSGYQARGRFAAWLFTIARRRCVDHFRKPHEMELNLNVMPDQEAIGHTHPDSLDGRAVLESLISNLTAEEAELLRLRYAADLSYADIAPILGKSEAACRMAHSRLIRRLQALQEVQDG